ARTSRLAGIAAGVAAVVLVVADVLTESRGAWLAAAAGLAVALAAGVGARRCAAALAAAAGLLLLAAYALTAFTIPARLQARGDYWHVAWRVAGEHAARGTGAGTYDLAWAAFGDLDRWQGVLDAHSLYLEGLAELGVVG